MRVYRDLDELIGGTPLVELRRLAEKNGINSRLYAKLEGKNPAGSAKDRVALFMLNDAEEKGLLKPGGTVIEPTSGNTGIALAALGAARGYRVIMTMPDTMSVERQRMIRAYGAEIVLTDGALGMAGAVKKAEELKAEIDGAYIPDQFSNPANPAAHYATTGPEIWVDTNGEVDIFVAGIGTGGTLSGTGRFLKKKRGDICVVGVEPASSPLITEGRAGAHRLQGIGANFIPANFDPEVCDHIMAISDEDAINTMRELAETEGILAGISSGAALCAAIRLAETDENRGKCIVVLLPDGGEKYLSTEAFA